MATEIKGPIKLLLHELFLVLFCPIFEKKIIFSGRVCKNFYMLFRVFHVRLSVFQDRSIFPIQKLDIHVSRTKAELRFLSCQRVLFCRRFENPR